MKKCFNNVQMLWTSENCNSAKVVEKLLRNVITRRTLVRRGYLIEQGAQNKESLFSCATWLMRLPRRILRMLLVMTLPALALIFTLVTTAESRADCSRPTNGVCKTLGESGTCGKGCSYTYDSVTQTVNITATGEDAEIAHLAFHRLYYEGDSMPVQTYIINGAVKVGENVIASTTSRVIFGADGVLTLNGIGHNAFGDSTLSGTIVIPEGATFGPLFFYNVKLADKAKIYCGVENCAQKMIDACNAYSDDKAASKCLNSVNKIVSDDKLLAYPENCLKMGVNGCTKCKSENFRLNDGYCDRIRYTPAEAAEVLHDNDTNEVTITFRK